MKTCGRSLARLVSPTGRSNRSVRRSYRVIRQFFDRFAIVSRSVEEFCHIVLVGFEKRSQIVASHEIIAAWKTLLTAPSAEYIMESAR